MQFNLPYRQYLWKGGFGVDINGDGEVKDIMADPDATPPIEASIETTVPWCFVYGEREWLDRKKFSTIKSDADWLNEQGNPKSRTGHRNCETGEVYEN